ILRVVGVMTLFCVGCSRTFRRCSPLDAYRLDILGSLPGLIALSVLAFLGAPPLAWGSVVALALVLLADRSSRIWQLPVLGIMLVLLGVESIVPTDSWSPYYKIRLITQPSGAVSLFVNGIPHQTMEAAEKRLNTVTLYGLVYQRTPSIPKNVLIVGAGTGVDVAVALKKGVQHVDAVEIDPRIHAIGAQQNPDRPFQDPRVTSYVNDGRAFLEQPTRRSDLTLFALPASTGHFARLALLMASASPDALQCPRVWKTASATVAAPATDDYPFLYLKDRTIPGFYLLTLALILLAALLLIRVTAGTLHRMGGYLDLFFMGPAFLLLETKDVVLVALLLGTAVFVNSLVFLGILVAVYLAIELARRIDLGASWRLYT